MDDWTTISTAELAALRARVAELENEHSAKLKAVLEYLRPDADTTPKMDEVRWGTSISYGEHCDIIYEMRCRLCERAVQIAEASVSLL